jgi:ELWxxDGT repeat protein
MQRQIVIFQGADASNNVELWETNRTAAGTHELTGISGADQSGVFGWGINASIGGVIPGFTPLNGEVLFEGLDANRRLGLWVSDGSAAGTHELTGINGTYSSGIFSLGSANFTVLPDFTVFNGEVLFSGVNASRTVGLWETNGTVAGTHEITGISGVTTSLLGLAPNNLTVFRLNVFSNPEVLFSGYDAKGLNGLWVTDGTAAGTSELTGISGVSPNGFGPSDLTVLKLGSGITASFEVLFAGFDPSSRSELWVTNGAAVGTHELTGVGDASSGLSPSDITVFGQEVVFNGLNTSGNRGLGVSDGTIPGTHELTGIGGAISSGINPKDMTVFNGQVLFNGENASGQLGLWVTNGTAAGTHELSGVAGRASSGIDPSALTVVNGEVLFNGTDVNNKRSLWETDGTVVGTHELAIGGVGSGGLNPSDFTSVVLTIPPADNFNSNNTSDILFRNNSTGDTWYEGMNNGAPAGWFQIGGSDTSYGVIGTGDFFGTGTSDILYRNDSTGDTWFEAISNGVFVDWHQVGGSDTHYAAAGVGDFDANGTSDILFRNNSTGDTWYEAMNNGAFAGWTQIGGSDTSFSVVGLGDFNSDGADDILFRNSLTGDTWYEALNNGAFAGWQQIGGSDTHYSVVGVGDFLGTGTDDILFRNNTTGDTWFLRISNGAFGWNEIGGSDTNYAVVGIGDYFGNNTSGILFRNNTTGDTWFEGISNGAFGWFPISGSNAAYSVPNVLGPPSLK